MKQDKKDSIRPPIVTILGHVDHGKTTLLDAIRKTNVVGKEHGGITQHIGAYQIEFQKNQITFIDTPGHAAFEKMRSRGAKVADIAVLAVAANDSVKPQTVEAIKHITKAKIPMIVAITKTDLEGIQIEKVKKDLDKNGVTVESYGGDVPVVEVAATKGKGLNDLLEIIHLVWQVNPKANLSKEPLEAVVVESYLDKYKGAIVSVVIKQGTLNVGQKIQVDDETIKVKAIIDDLNKNIKDAGPSKPVEILGFKKVLDVGSIVYQTIKTHSNTVQKDASHEQIIAKNQEKKDKFNIIVKSDVLGSLEAIKENLPEKILTISEGVGEVNPADVNLAKIAKAPIIAFNVNITTSVQKQADQEKVLIRSYKIIYELIDDLEEIVKGFEQTKHEIKLKGKGKIVATFNIEGQKIAGTKIVSGKMNVGDKILLKKENSDTFESEIISLKKFRKNIHSVTAGQECGIGFMANLDFKEGDSIESLG